MSRRLLWKICITIGAGVVALFYLIDLAVSQIEDDMSLIAEVDRAELASWAQEAESLYRSGSYEELENWLSLLQLREETWAVVAEAKVARIAGSLENADWYLGYNLGRSIDWQIHLYFEDNPVMELPFASGQASLLVELPQRMRPGNYWTQTRITLQVILPLFILSFMSIVLYLHIMGPLKQLQQATRAFSQGDFEVRVREVLGSRDDELAQLANTFDRMAERIGDQIISQRQLITDLSHELRTPLTRLDIAIDSLIKSADSEPVIQSQQLQRIHRESRQIRRLVDDTLTLSWLQNEGSEEPREALDLVDLLEVLIDDARFEYPDRVIVSSLPDCALVANSNHRLLGQALENILRNAMRYTPVGKSVSVQLERVDGEYQIRIADEGPGIPEQHLNAIFQPFFRVEAAQPTDGTSFGLGLALAKRQLAAVTAKVRAFNRSQGGLEMVVLVPHANG
ncbi:MAG: histidine kinase sensor domain-containing protein [Pseudomonadota bacterium]